MRFLISFVLRVADLVEAEGRLARDALLDVAIACAFMLTAAALATFTCVAAAGALLFSLMPLMSTGGALALVALMLALCTVVAWVLAQRSVSRGSWSRREWANDWRRFGRR